MDIKLRSVISVLKRLEWSKTYSYCTGWPSCPICRGIRPGFGADSDGESPINSGHRADCELAKALNDFKHLENK
ncbi:MAG: hypothetical protein PVI43_00225 [Candidatus Bathyarchaeota archaeon]